jgi:hypothetical protein
LAASLIPTVAARFKMVSFCAWVNDWVLITLSPSVLRRESVTLFFQVLYEFSDDSPRENRTHFDRQNRLITNKANKYRA